MSTLSVPLTEDAERALKNLMNSGYAENKAQAMRKAILKAEEDVAIANVLIAEQEVREGKLLSGNLDELVKKL